MDKLTNLLNNSCGNYLYPFFWQHGETDAVLTEYMDAISDCGMKAACVEARPHPDYAGPGWWEDLRLIIQRAKEHKMKLWILDDSHFPTGYANGRIKETYPGLRKWYLDMRRFDVAGPVVNGKINMQYLSGRSWEGITDPEEEPILGIFAAMRKHDWTEPGDPVNGDAVKEITDCYHNGILTWDIPPGNWSIFVIFQTRKRGEKATEDYLNPLVKEATQVLIETVYEPHYEQLGDEFGKTILGFFSDEPRFGNEKGTQSVIGREGMVLPWRPGLEKELGFERKLLPFLFADGGGIEKAVRCQYMDVITRLYNENFTRVLATWCEEHGICYLGHNIEDNGAHARLGYGAGHFFRAQEAQHFSGIDVIGTQIVPGMPYHHDGFATGGCDGSFYHYALAKLGSSAAHLDAKKQGRAMCEAFGAYGWNEGLKLMKWITDHLIVRGINYIVPHAFDPRAYPDWDCPPHFYAHGHNPQFRYFKYYSSYANRLMELFQGGEHRAPAAVLYPAEMEWAGDYIPVEQPVRELTQAQIDCDIISVDYLLAAEIQEQQLEINGERFAVLIVPGSSYIPAAAVAKMEQAAAAGVAIIFVEKPPRFPAGAEIQHLQQCRCVPLEDLAEACDEYREIRLEPAFKNIVYYHYEHDDMHVFMLFNEHLYETCEGMAELPYQGECYEYDAYENVIRAVRRERNQDGQSIAVEIAPYESKVYILPKKKLPLEPLPGGCGIKRNRKRLELTWQISYADAAGYPQFQSVGELDQLTDIREYEQLESASGTIRYEADFSVENRGEQMFVEIEQAYEVAEVFINGQSAGVRICPPYRFDLSSHVKEGSNRLVIEVTNTLGNTNRDGMSQYLVIEPFGIVGAVYLVS